MLRSDPIATVGPPAGEEVVLLLAGLLLSVVVVPADVVNAEDWKNTELVHFLRRMYNLGKRDNILKRRMMATIGRGQAVEERFRAGVASPELSSESRQTAIPRSKCVAKRTHDHLV